MTVRTGCAPPTRDIARRHPGFFRPRPHMGEMTVRHGRARIEVHDPYAVPDAFSAQTFGKHHQGCVAHASGDVAGVGKFSCDADHVSHHAAFSGLHAWQDGAGQIDIAEHLEIPALPPGGAMDALQRSGWDIAGIVHQNIHVSAGLTQYHDSFGLR